MWPSTDRTQYRPWIANDRVGTHRRSHCLRSLKYVGLMLVCFVLVRPTLLAQIPTAGEILKVCTTAIFLSLVLDRVVNHRGEALSATMVLLVAYRLSLLVGTVANDGDYLSWGYVSMTQLATLLLIEAQFRRGNESARRLLRVLADLLILYLAINFVMIKQDLGYSVSWGQGEFEQATYLLGIRTRITDCIFLSILVALLYDAMSRRRIPLRTILTIMLGVVQTTILHVATGLVGLCVFGLVYATMMVFKKGASLLFSMRAVTTAGLLLTILVVGYRAQDHFSGLITNVLGKSPELTGRTSIWNDSIPILWKSPIFGYGIDHQFGAFVPGLGGLLWQAHNQYLQIIHDGGIVGLFLFVGLLFVCGNGVDRIENRLTIKAPFVSVYAAMSVMAVSEIFVYNMGMLFLLLFLASRADQLFPID